METLGALTLGGAVSDTIRKKIVDPKLFEHEMPQFMIGQACAMLGAASWQILASILKMPVSGTHSIVGAVLGKNFFQKKNFFFKKKIIFSNYLFIFSNKKITTSKIILSVPHKDNGRRKYK